MLSLPLTAQFLTYARALALALALARLALDLDLDLSLRWYPVSSSSLSGILSLPRSLPPPIALSIALSRSLEICSMQ